MRVRNVHPAIRLLGCASLLVAGIQNAWSSDPVDAAIEGSWLVTAAEQGGKPFDAIKGGKLTIAGDTFQVTTAAGNHYSGKLRTRTDVSPRQLDFLLDNGPVWHAIYSVSGAVLRYIYVEADDGTPRPTVFATTADTPGTAIVMRRADTP